MDIHLFNVPITCLREKMAAYATLFDHAPRLLVSGTFRDQDGELVFLSRRLYRTEPAGAFRRWLPVWVDAELVKLTPVDEVIAEIKLTPTAAVDPLTATFLTFLYAVALYALATLAFVRSIEYLWAASAVKEQWEDRREARKLKPLPPRVKW